MLTKINANAGVPVGTKVNNYFDYLNKNSFVALESLVAPTFQGGSSATSPLNFSVASPFSLEKPNSLPSALFARSGVSRALVSVPVETVTNVFHTWQMALTDADNIQFASGSLPSAVSLIYSNIDVNQSTEKRKLPFKLNGANGTASGYFVTFNNILQSDYVYTAPNALPSPSNSSLVFSKLNYGSHLPKLTNSSSQIIDISGNNFTTGFTLTQLNNLSSQKNISFPNSLLNVGEYTHLVLQAKTALGLVKEYFYLEAEFDYDVPLPQNKWRVKDKTLGIIEVNLDINAILTECYGSAVVTNKLFQICIVEQLLEEKLGFITNYSSGYGNVYDGDTTNVKLFKLEYTGASYNLSLIPSTSYIAVAGENIYSSSTVVSENIVVLAMKYNGRPYVDYESLKLKYFPDFFEIYYSPMDASVTNPKLILEKNLGDFYNASVIEQTDSRYNPVHRGEYFFYKIVQNGIFTPTTNSVTTPEFSPTVITGLNAANATTLSGEPITSFVRTNPTTAQVISGGFGLTLNGNFTIPPSYTANLQAVNATNITLSGNLTLTSGTINTSNTISTSGLVSANVITSGTTITSSGDIITGANFRIGANNVVYKSAPTTLKIKSGTGVTVNPATDFVHSEGLLFENNGTTISRVYSPNNPPPSISAPIVLSDILPFSGTGYIGNGTYTPSIYMDVSSLSSKPFLVHIGTVYVRDIDPCTIELNVVCHDVNFVVINTMTQYVTRLDVAVNPTLGGLVAMSGSAYMLAHSSTYYLQVQIKVSGLGGDFIIPSQSTRVICVEIK